MRTALCLLPVLAIAVFFLIRAELLGRRYQVYFFKPLSTLIVIAIALLSLWKPTRNLTYTVGVLVGLLFSLGGDIALMFAERRQAFLIGLGLFLTAHIAYSIVFVLLGRFSGWDLLSGAVLLTAGMGFYRVVRPNLGSMRRPVIAYMVIISIMVHRALATLASPVFQPGQAGMVAVGAVLFYLSDLVLAANRFWRPLRCHRLSLALYHGGQCLLALAASYFV
jgi:uncharacterized membrane protein YhhN